MKLMKVRYFILAVNFCFYSFKDYHSLNNLPKTGHSLEEYRLADVSKIIEEEDANSLAKHRKKSTLMT
jgi:hypothetical protein